MLKFSLLLMSLALAITSVGLSGTVGSALGLVNCDMSWAGLPDLDRDCDRLADSWETGAKGGAGGLDLHVAPYSADPDVKDIFVEIDYMTGYMPSSAVTAAVANAFANSGIINVAGHPTGIKVHFFVNEEISPTVIHGSSSGTCMDTTTFPSIKNNWFGLNGAERSNTALMGAKRGIFHYGLFIDKQCGALGSSGTSETPGDDFIVSLGAFANTDTQKEGTLMHELGHNLGLKHGGNVAVNCKPNYASVMNWIFQMKSYVADTPNSFPDYSKSLWGPTGGLPETNLNEAAGIGPSGLHTAIGGGVSPNPLVRIVPTGTGINYDDDTMPANSTDTAITRNLNNFGYPSPFSEDNCNSIQPPPANTLFSYVDWGNCLTCLQYWGTDSGWDAVDPIDPGTGLPIFVTTVKSDIGSNQSAITGNNTNPSVKGNALFNHTDVTIDMVRLARLQLLQGIDHAIQILPDTAFADPESANKTKADLDQIIISGNNSIANLTQSDNLDEAIKGLKNLREKMDSSFGGNAKDDLIVDNKAQAKIVPLIDNCIGVLDLQR